MSQVLDRRLIRFQRIKAQRKAKAIERATVPGAPNATVMRNVMRWKKQRQKREG